MGKLLRKKQPTVAEYFQSESQRKKTSRLSFIYGSKRLVAVIAILVLTSGIAGIAILQKQKSSSAAVERIGVSFSKADSLTPVGAWYLTNTSNNANLTIQSKDNDELKLGFHAGGSGRFEYGNGYQVCWNIKPGSATQYLNLKYNSLTLSYSTNEAGTNGMAIYVNGQQAGLSYDSAPGQHQGGAVFNKTITAQLGAIDPGTVVSICNVKIGGSTAYFGSERTIRVYAYTFGASFDQEQDVEIIGTVSDSADKGIAGVKISNCKIYPAATTDVNGQFRFYIRKGDPFCVRTQEGLSPDKYSGVKATNKNHPPLSSDGASYEGQATTARRTNYDFKATLKTTTPPPAPTPAQPAPTGSVIDQNRFSAWGFPLPTNPAANHTIEHGNNGKLTINYDKYSYSNGLTGCWSTTVAPGNTATSLSATIASNDAGRNVVLFRATGNADKQLDRATNGKVVWNMPSPVSSGGTISICSKVNNPDNKAFEEKKTLTVSSYTIYGSGARVTDTTPPSVSITSPANGSTQKGTIKVTATASDPSGIQYVEIKNSSNVLKQIAAAPYEYSLDTTKLPDGDYTIAALARDNAGNFKTSSDITIKINNKVTPAPSAGGGASTSPGSTSTANPNCKAGTTTGMTVPVAATEGTITGNAVKTGGTVQLKDAGDYVECYIKLPADAQPGGYVLAASGRAGLSPGQAFNTNYDGSTIQYYMTGGSGGNQKSIGTYDDLGSINSVKRSPIVRTGTGDTVRTLQPGELVLARITLQKPSSKHGQFFVENLQLFKDPCTNASGDTIADGSVVNGITCNAPPSTSSTTTTGGSSGTAAPSSPKSCEAGNFAEAENGIRKPDGANNTASAIDHVFPSVRAAVLLSDNSYVECTLTASKTGTYAFGAKIRSQDYKKIVAQANLKMTKVGGGTSKERTVNASKGESYSLVRFNEKADYIQLNEGQKAVVRVTFLNDGGNGSDGDRNLWVDNLQLVEIPPSSSGGNTGGSSDGGEVSSSSSCVKDTTSTEAEDGVLSPNSAQVQSDKNRSGKSIVRISGNNGFVQCTLKAPLKGDYVVGAIVKSDNAVGAGRATAVLSTIGGNKTLTDERDASGDWDNIRQRANGDIRRSLNAGDTIVVRIGIKNASNSLVSKRNLLVDRIELVKIPDQNNPSSGANQPAAPGSEVTTIPIKDGEQGAEVTQYDTATGTLIKFVQAEKARYQGAAFDDPIAAEQKAVRLYANKNFVEYNIYFPETDTYSLDFAARSEDYKNETANARIVLDKDRVFGNDIKLQKSADYKYYTSEKRVSVKKGNHVFRIEFTNNKEGGGEDRNLLIDYLRIRGSKKLIDTAPPGANTSSPVAPTFVPLAPNTTVIEAERASSCVMKKAAYPCDRLAIGDNAAYGGQGLVLNNKNDSAEAEFTVPVTGTYAVSVLMRSMDFAGSGSAKADIYGQTTKIKDDYIPDSSSYSSYAFATKRLEQGSKYKVKVVSTYDKYSGPNADVNLLVDQFRLRLVKPTASTSIPAQSTQNNEQPEWAQSTKNNVLATEWACSPPPVSEYGSFYCPAATKKHVGVMLISYPTNGGRTGQAMVYIPEKMIKQKQSGNAVTPLPLVFYLHGRGTARLTADMSAVAPDGANVPAFMKEGFWKNNETSGKLDAAYNTANDAKYGGVIIVAPTGQGRMIDGRDWGYVPSIKDFSMLPRYIEESLSYVKVDKRRIYTMGSSMGGHNSLQFALLHPDLIAAAYSNDGVSDWAERYRQAVAKNDLDLMATIPYETGGLPSDVPREYALRSPLNNLNPTSAKVPIKIDVDMQDSLVSPSQSIIFYEKMKQLNPNAPEITKNPNTGHSTALQPEGRSRTPGSPKIYLRAMDFFYNGGNWL